MDKNNILKKANQLCKNTLMETLSIRFVDIGVDFLSAEMKVHSKVHQPDGILHGGATLALAETVGSAAPILLYPNKEIKTRCIQITANHVKSVFSGKIIAIAKPIHAGKTTQVWSVKVVDENKNLISICQMVTKSIFINSDKSYRN